MESSLSLIGFKVLLAQVWFPFLMCSSIPFGTPPGPPDPAMVRVAPEECLFYVNWAGTTTPRADSPNRAERFLADPEFLRLRAEAGRRFWLLIGKKFASTMAESPDTPESTFHVADAQFFGELLVTRPCAFFVNAAKDQTTESPWEGGFVMNVRDSEKPVAEWLDRVMKPIPDIERIDRDGHTEYYAKESGFHAALDHEYLIITLGQETPQGIAQRMSGAEPSWVAEAGRALPLERRAVLLRIDLSALAKAGDSKTTPDAEAAELIAQSHLRTITLVTGFDGEDFVSRMLVETDAVGALLLQQQLDRPLTRADLSVIPRDANLALAMRIEPKLLAMAWQRTTEMLKTSDTAQLPSPSEYATYGVRSVLDAASSELPFDVSDTLMGPSDFNSNDSATGIDLNSETMRELFASLDDVCRLYNSPSEGSSIVNGMTGVVHVKDAERLTKLFEQWAAPASAADVAPAATDSPPKAHWVVRKARFADHDIYYMPGKKKDALGVLTWSLVDHELVFAMSPQNVKAYLLRAPGLASLADEPVAGAALQAGRPIGLMYENSPEMLRLTYPMMQGFANVVAAQSSLPTDGVDPLLLPAMPTFAQYMHPATSTMQVTSKGVEVTVRQSLPHGNLGAVLYVVVCSLFPENIDAIGAQSDAESNNSESAANSTTEATPVVQLTTFTEKSGPCSLKKRKAADHNDGAAADQEDFTVELGNNIHCVAKFCLGEFVGRSTINANPDVTNISDKPRICEYHVAFFDKDGNLVGCCSQGTSTEKLPAGKTEHFASCLIDLSDEAAASVTSYKIRLYESE